MTSDEFTSKYRLLKQIEGKTGRSYTAEHRSSGRAVLVHILEESRVGGSAGLNALIDRLPAGDKSKVLGTMTVDQSLVVVTQFLQNFEGFESWLRARTSAPGTPPLSPADLPPEYQGEFTKLFHSPEGAPAPPPVRPPAREDRGHSPSPPVGSQFTDLFRAPAGPPTPAPGPDRSAIPPVRFVGLRVPLPSEPGSPGPEPPRLRPNFGASGDRAAQPDLAASLPHPGQVNIRAPEPVEAAPPPPAWPGPSEFTRQLGTVSQPTGELPQGAGGAEPSAESADPKRSYVPLLLVLNLVLIVATGVIVYFMLRRC